MNLYSLSPRAFSQDSEITAHIYSTHASAALTLKTEIVGLTNGMQTRHSIGIAQGLLMLRYGLDPRRRLPGDAPTLLPGEHQAP